MKPKRCKPTSYVLRVVLCTIAVLVLASCATGYGVNRDGYGQRYPGASSYVDVVGSVVGLERGYDRIVLEVRGDSYEQSGYYDQGRQVEVRYTRDTTLIYQGRAFPVEGLERGDVIRIEGQRIEGRRSGNILVANSIDVLRNVRDHRGGGYDDGYGDYGDDYGYGESLRGTVRYVQARDRVISLDSVGGERVWIRYDQRTIVEYDGRRRYQPTDLERGDFVRIEAQRYGNDWVAEVIHVQRDATR